MANRKGKDEARNFMMLKVKGMQFDPTQEKNADHPLMRKAVQLVLEVMDRQKSEALLWNVESHEADVLVVSGLTTKQNKAPFDEDSEWEEQISKRLADARKEEKVFPSFTYDPSTIHLLTITNKHSNPLQLYKLTSFQANSKLGETF